MNDGTTPVFMAAMEGNVDVLKLLASLGVDVTVIRKNEVIQCRSRRSGVTWR